MTSSFGQNFAAEKGAHLGIQQGPILIFFQLYGAIRFNGVVIHIPVVLATLASIGSIAFLVMTHP